MRVLLFGATGYLGRFLANHLLEEGHRVTSCVRKPDVPGPSYPCVVWDLATGTPPEIASHDAAIYCAQSRHYKGDIDRGDVVAVNVLGVARAAELCARIGVSRFVLISTGSVYGTADAPLSELSPLAGQGPYAVSKRMGEEVLRLFDDDFESVILRLFALYGPGQLQRMVPEIVSRVARRDPVTLQPRHPGEAETRGLHVSLFNVQDAVKVVAASLSRLRPGTYNAGEGHPTSVAEIAEVAAGILGVEARFETRG
ncbi:MAG: NAD(P)-dependent oxidoreductase, partial [Myxococcales bacterium]|nr:NAD(P)-dependent oxidoreductase [Myxococcales bacterium]